MSTAVSETAQKLKAALELLGPNGENWGQYEYERNGVRCGVGACRAAGIVLPHAHLLLNEHVPNHNFPIWQDAYQRTFAEVKAVFEKAIEANL